MSDSLQILVNEWLRLDKNETTRNEIQQLLRDGNKPELERRMRVRIEFGTSGLRGRMEAGWARMNDLIIIQASQGLCAYVLKTLKDAANRGIVIGYDHRHNSERWASLTASAFIANGVKVYLHHGLVHTPMVPFSVKKLNAACGVMVTASHNPKQDNGYKVYWENGVQIIGPHDTGIAESIRANLEPKTWTIDIQTSPLCIDRTAEMRDAYFAQLQTLCLSRPLNSKLPIKFVNTSMHGVGDEFAKRAFELFGFAPYIPVKEQQFPDPEFPTVKFPNPEEKGALDLAIETADRGGATYVVAQDPDADRFSAAEKGSDGKWYAFTGDQLGSLFVYRALLIYKASGKPLDKLAMVASAVSSKMIEAMAKAEGFKFVECLTGFKFIGNTALTLVDQGYEVPFGYEESIGFMFGSEIRDKDGVAATVSFAEMVATAHEQGQTMRSQLTDLYKRYGYFQTSNSYFICNDPPTVDKIFARLRNYDIPKSSSGSGSRANYPQQIAGLSITRVVDLTTGNGYDSTNTPTFKPSLPLSSGHMIQFRAEDVKTQTKIVLTIRTSGTEPKIKYYLEGSTSGTDAETQVGKVLAAVVAELGDIWLEAKQNALASPSSS